MQAAQNTAQIFLGVNLECNACHDSFISKWKLKDAYALASFFSRGGTTAVIPLRRRAGRSTPRPGSFSASSPRACVRRRSRTGARRRRRSSPIRATAGCRGRWSIASGSGCSAAASSENPDEMDGEPWSPALLDWLAERFRGPRLRHEALLATIVASRAYQMPAVPRDGRAAASGTCSRGPEIRRLTAEQFADADRHRSPATGMCINRRRSSGGGGQARAARRLPAAGRYTREWRVAGKRADTGARPADSRPGLSRRATARRPRFGGWSW